MSVYLHVLHSLHRAPEVGYVPRAYYDTMGISTVIKDYGTEILNAIRDNDLQALKAILEKHLKSSSKIARLCVSDIKHRPSKKFACPLILAARQEDPKIIRYMMEKGADPNFVHHTIFSSKRREDVTALHIAVDMGLYETVAILLDANANPNLPDHNDETPLHIAVKKADRTMTMMLMSHGASPEITDRRGNAVLHIATMYGHLQLVRIMLKYNADVYQKGQFGAIPPHIAAKEGHIHLIQLFCSRDVGNINIKIPCYDHREKAPIHLAAENGHIETVRSLLTQFDAEVNLKDSDGNTALHCCVINLYDSHRMRDKDEFTETARSLIRHHVSVNEKNVFGDTALHLAAMNRFQRIVELLLEVGANPFVENDEGLKPIDVVPDSDPVTKNVLKMAMLNPRRPREISNLTRSMDTLENQNLSDINRRHVKMTDGIVESSSQSTPENALDHSLSIQSLSQGSDFPSVFEENQDPQGLGRVPVGSKPQTPTKDRRKENAQHQADKSQDSDFSQSQSSQPSQPKDKSRRHKKDAKSADHPPTLPDRRRENEITSHSVSKDQRKKTEQVTHVQDRHYNDDALSFVTDSSFADTNSVFSVGAGNSNALVQREIQKLFSKQQMAQKKQKRRQDSSIASDTHSYMDESITDPQNDSFEQSISEEPSMNQSYEKEKRKKSKSRGKENNPDLYKDDKVVYENIPDPDQTAESWTTTESITSEESSRRKKKKKGKSKLDAVLASAQQSKHVVPYDAQGKPFEPGSVKVNTVPGRPGTIEVQYSGGPITISVDTSAVDQMADGQYYFTDQYGRQFPVDLQNPNDLMYLQQLQQQTEKPPALPPKGEPIYANMSELFGKGKQPLPSPSKSDQFPNGSVSITEVDDTQDSDEMYEEQQGDEEEYEEDVSINRMIKSKVQEVTKTPVPASRSTPTKDKKKPIKKPRSNTSFEKQPEKPMVVTRAVSIDAEEDEDISPDEAENVSPQYKTFAQKLLWAKSGAGEKAAKPGKKNRPPIQFDKPKTPQPREEDEERGSDDSEESSSSHSEDESVIVSPFKNQGKKQAKKPSEAPKKEHDKMYSLTPDIEVEESESSSESSDGESSVVHKPRPIHIRETSVTKMETVMLQETRHSDITRVEVLEKESEVSKRKPKARPRKTKSPEMPEPTEPLPTADDIHARERAQRQKAEEERAEQQRAEREKAAREKAEREQAEREKAEREQAAREKAEKERIKQEKAEKKKAKQEKAEREKAAREKAEREQAEREEAEIEEAERQQAERERIEREKAEEEKVKVILAEEVSREQVWERYDQEPGRGRGLNFLPATATLEVSSTLNERSQSVDSLASDYSEGGTRRLNMRVTGEVPKAYTRAEKDPARRAFFGAVPQSVESGSEASDVELGSRNSLTSFGSRSSLTERTLSPASAERAKRWTSENRPVEAKSPEGLLPRNSPSQQKVVSPIPPDHKPGKTKLIGSYTQPYKSFGKIEVKTDALNEALANSPLSTSFSPEPGRHSPHHKTLPTFPSSEVKITPSKPDIEKANIIKPQAISAHDVEIVKYPTVPQEKEAVVSVDEPSKLQPKQPLESTVQVGKSQSAFKKNIKVVETGRVAESTEEHQSIEEARTVEIYEQPRSKAQVGEAKSGFKKNIKVMETGPRMRTSEIAEQELDEVLDQIHTIVHSDPSKQKAEETKSSLKKTNNESEMLTSEQAKQKAVGKTRKTVSLSEERVTESGEKVKTVTTTVSQLKTAKSQSVSSIFLVDKSSSETETSESEDETSSDSSDSSESQEEYETERGQIQRQRSESMDLLTSPQDSSKPVFSRSISGKKPRPQLSSQISQEDKDKTKSLPPMHKPQISDHKSKDSSKADPNTKAKKRKEILDKHEQKVKEAEKLEKQQKKTQLTTYKDRLKQAKNEDSPPPPPPPSNAKDASVDQNEQEEELPPPPLPISEPPTTRTNGPRNSGQTFETNLDDIEPPARDDYERYEEEPGARRPRPKPAGQVGQAVSQDVKAKVSQLTESQKPVPRPRSGSTPVHFETNLDDVLTPVRRTPHQTSSESLSSVASSVDTVKQIPMSAPSPAKDNKQKPQSTVTKEDQKNEPKPLQLAPKPSQPSAQEEPKQPGQEEPKKPRIKGRRVIGKPRRGEQVIQQDDKAQTQAPSRPVNTSFGPEDEEVATITSAAKDRKQAIKAKKLREYEWALKQKSAEELEKIRAEEEFEQAMMAAKAQHGKALSGSHSKIHNTSNSQILQPIPGVEITISGGNQPKVSGQEKREAMPLPASSQQMIPKTISTENLAEDKKKGFLKFPSIKTKRDKEKSTDDLTKDDPKKKKKKKTKKKKSDSSSDDSSDSDGSNVYEVIADVPKKEQRGAQPLVPNSPQSPEGQGIEQTVMGAQVERDDTIKQRPSDVRKGLGYNLPVKKERRDSSDDGYDKIPFDEAAEVVPKQSGLSQTQILANMMKEKEKQRKGASNLSRQAAMDSTVSEEKVDSMQSQRSSGQLQFLRPGQQGQSGQPTSMQPVQTHQGQPGKPGQPTGQPGKPAVQTYQGQPGKTGQPTGMQPVQAYPGQPAYSQHQQGMQAGQPYPVQTRPTSAQQYPGQPSKPSNREAPKETCIDDDLPIAAPKETNIDDDIMSHPAETGKNLKNQASMHQETNLDDVGVVGDENEAPPGGFSRSQVGRKSRGRKKRDKNATSSVNETSSTATTPAVTPSTSAATVRAKSTSSLPPNPSELSQMWSSNAQQEEDMMKALESMDNVYEQPVCHQEHSQHHHQHHHQHQHQPQPPPVASSQGRPPLPGSRGVRGPEPGGWASGQVAVVDMQPPSHHAPPPPQHGHPYPQPGRPPMGASKSMSHLGAASDSESTGRQPGRLRARRKGRRSASGGGNGHHSDAEMQDFEAPQMPQSPGISLQEAALQTITQGLQNQPKITPLRPLVPEAERQINYTRGVYRPKPMQFLGSSNSRSSMGSLHSSRYEDSRYDDSSLVSQMWSEKYPTRSGGESEGEADTDEPGYDERRYRPGGQGQQYPGQQYPGSQQYPGPQYPGQGGQYPGQGQQYPGQPGQQQYPGQGQPGQPGNPQGPSVGHLPPAAPANDSPARRRPKKKRKPIAEPGPVDFSQYSPTVRLWMEHVDKKTVQKSDTMFLQVMPTEVKPAADIQKAFRMSTTSMGDDDVFLPPQYVMARGRSIRRKKRAMERAGVSGTSSGGSDAEDVLAPNEKQMLLFFRVGNNWHDLAWVLFDSIQTDTETIRMLKDIEIKFPKDLSGGVHDMMNRWWRKRGKEATIEELRRSLDMCHIPYLMEEISPTRNSTLYSGSEDNLDTTALSDQDPDVSRLMHEYEVRSLNASMEGGALSDADPRRSFNLSADNLMRSLKEKGVTINRSKLGSLGRSQTGSFMDSSHDQSMDYYSDTESRRSFVIVQPQLKGGDYRHETNL